MSWSASIAIKSARRSSIAMTVALRVALAVAFVCTLVFIVLYVGMAQQSRSLLLGTVDTDIAGLVDSNEAEGLPGLVARLDDRLALSPTREEQPYYLLRDPAGKVLAGNVMVWPALRPERSETGTITCDNHVRVLARVTRLRGGSDLLVGRATTARDHTLGRVRVLFIAAILVMVTAAFVIGALAARRLRVRVDHINGIFERFGDGGLPARAEVAGRRDELDQLGLHINAVLDRVERLLAAQRDISDNIAHEARTPLMGLNQRIEAALELSRDPAVNAHLEAAQSQVKALLRLLDALLDIASAEAQRGDLRALGEIDLSKVAVSLADLYAPSIEEAGLTLLCDIDDDVIMRADAMQMSRLLVNLFDNALKYGAAAGGVLYFAIKPGPIITVADQGPGIAEIDRLRIFERYRRSGDTGGRGHGLGLALVAAIASRHRLTVAVEDTRPGEVNKGARFVIRPEGDV